MLNERKKLDFSKHPDENLVAFIMANKANLRDKAACQVEMDRRRFWREFWSKGLVAWIALVIALASLIWQIAKEIER